MEERQVEQELCQGEHLNVHLLLGDVHEVAEQLIERKLRNVVDGSFVQLLGGLLWLWCSEGHDSTASKTASGVASGHTTLVTSLAKVIFELMDDKGSTNDRLLVVDADEAVCNVKPDSTTFIGHKIAEVTDMSSFMIWSSVRTHEWVVVSARHQAHLVDGT